MISYMTHKEDDKLGNRKIKELERNFARRQKLPALDTKISGSINPKSRWRRKRVPF